MNPFALKHMTYAEQQRFRRAEILTAVSEATGRRVQITMECGTCFAIAIDGLPSVSVSSTDTASTVVANVVCMARSRGIKVRGEQ